MTISTRILERSLNSKVRKDDVLKLHLAQVNGVKVDTVNRWLRENDVVLTTATNLELIRSHFKLAASSKLTQPSIDKRQVKTT